MKIDLQNPPKYIKCLKSFYDFDEGHTYYLFESEINEGLLYVNTKDEMVRSRYLYLELLEALKDGYFAEHKLTLEEEFEEELKKAADEAEHNFKGNTYERVLHGFKEGAAWMKNKLQNQ